VIKSKANILPRPSAIVTWTEATGQREEFRLFFRAKNQIAAGPADTAAIIRRGFRPLLFSSLKKYLFLSVMDIDALLCRLAVELATVEAVPTV
jgi:hypothetical protein